MAAIIVAIVTVVLGVPAFVGILGRL